MPVLIISSVSLVLFRGPISWILPLLLMQKGGPFLVGTSFAIANIDDTVFAFIGGSLGDRYGRKPVLILSAAFYFLVCLLFSLSLPLDGSIGQVIAFLATVCLYGVTGISAGPDSAIVAESIGEQSLGRAFSLLSTSSVVARAMGSLALGVVYRESPVTAGLVALALCLVAIVARLFLRETLEPNRDCKQLSFWTHTKGMLKRVRTSATASLISLVVLVVCNGLGHGISGNYYPPYLKDRLYLGEASIGAVYSVMALLQALLLPVAGWFADRYGPSAALVMGNVGAGAAVLVFALSPLTFIAVPATIVSGGLGAFHEIGYRVAVAKSSDRSYRSTLYGSLMSVRNAMFVLGPMIGGALYSGKPPLTFGVASLLLLLTFVPIERLRRAMSTGGRPLH